MLNYISKELIDKGWSGDQKYCITDENGTRCLLRISDAASYDRKKFEFIMMKWAASLKIPICLPIKFGTCKEGVYSVQSWIDGEDAEQSISGCSETEQYAYGLEAGRILRKIIPYRPLPLKRNLIVLYGASRSLIFLHPEW